MSLPPYTPGCDAVSDKIACDYPNPTCNLNKVVRTKFATSGRPAYNLVNNFKWSNADQNQVAKYIVEDKKSDTAAAEKWVDANPGKVKAWMAG